MKLMDNQPKNETRSPARKILFMLAGLLGSLIVGNIGIVLISPFDTPERLWILYFTWFWRFAFAGLAVLFFAKGRIWLSIGIMAAVIFQAFGL